MKYEYSMMKQIGSIKKLYFIDNGLLNSVSFKFSDNTGELMENAVFLHLKMAGKEVFYHKKSRECDFLVKEKNKIVDAVQAAYELNDESMEREIDGLAEAMEAHSLKTGTIVSYDLEASKTVKGRKIRIVPVWKYLLE